MSTPAGLESAESGLIQRVKEEMARQRMTLKELAARSELPYRTVQSWLLRHHRVPAAAVPNLARALGTSTDWLLTGAGAVFDREIVMDYLQVIEDIRNFSKGQTPFTECADIFINLYNDDYLKRRMASRHDMRLLERALAELRRLREGQ